MRKYANFTIIMLVDLIIVIIWGIDKFVRPLLPIHISPTVVLVIVITLIGFAITILQWERMWEERIGLPPPKFDSGVLGILPVIAMTVPLFSFVLPIMERLRKHFVDELLFKDGMNAYVTDDGIENLTERYKSSITELNSAFRNAIIFTIIALYIYFILPEAATFKLPIVELSVSKQLWITTAPIISFGLQLLVFTSFIWFMSLRLGLGLVIQEQRKSIPKLPFLDFTNIQLQGSIGHLWMIFNVSGVMKTKYNYIWYLPAIAIVILILISPLAICIFFVVQLFLVGNPVLGGIYSLLLIPYLFLLLLLAGLVFILGVDLEKYINKYVGGDEQIKLLLDQVSQGVKAILGRQ